jgi:cephalosporin hydroxylase
MNGGYSRLNQHHAMRLPLGGLGGLAGGALLLLVGTGCEPCPKTEVKVPVPVPLTEQQIAEKYHYAAYQAFAKNTAHFTWLGVETMQNPNDVWSYQQIFFEQKPDFVIEAGSHRGGGALLWATLMSPINAKAKVLTIDIEDKLAEARKVPLFKEKVQFFLGSSISDQVFGAIKKRVGAKKAIVILDSNHEKSHVLQEMMLYGDLVPVGSYLLVQDSNVNGHPAYPDFGPGPWEAIDEFMQAGGKSKGGATFELDRSRELLLFTMHPRGYLKRVK